MKKQIIALFVLLTQVTMPVYSDDETLHFSLESPQTEEQGITINFQDVSMLEFLRFVSTISERNFLYDEELLDFKISLVTGKATTPENILHIMLELLKEQGIKAEEKGAYYLVEKMDEWEIEELKKLKRSKYRKENRNIQTVSHQGPAILPFLQKQGDFYVYKLQYHVGTEIVSAIKNVAGALKASPNTSPDLMQAIGSMQWVESTNSLLYSGTADGIEALTDLVKSLDVPKKQVFIEVLVIETDVRKGLEFGLEWGGGGQYKNKFGYGIGNFPANRKQAPFAQTLQGINATNTPTGTGQFPIGRGFDLGVIGDIILHKGQSYFSLGSLVSALEADGDSSIILNQKIITQDNKPSRIFVGDNIAFTGSVVETIGASQQTSSNIEYRDVGVKLNITPLLGDGDVITMDIIEEITNVIPNQAQNGGIDTTKTDMATQVHVPDQSFLVLSGMIRNTKRQRKSGIPCLGGLPIIGAAFSKTEVDDEKRNVIVFVRPQIIRSDATYQNITTYQENQFREESVNPAHFQQGINMVDRKKFKNREFPKASAPDLIPSKQLPIQEIGAMQRGLKMGMQAQEKTDS
ncbi:secretin N-terminal domain-containing protein [Candidatus Neptunochlamydia vexilliferae]|uniref:Type II secretion system protein D n=1 Tax=Candidatus Neptunichlamydia vexilliferae TaxID=1651774 RepID=A0ABS0AZW2_9BACT|nr:secretin N-terminal domain-containing protein [Candidatus Neptunochlamydia vexilliferae]MBF5059656.1 hypothetical protein [Candidatus Neptunochlamydia vexilliferae]